MTLEDRIKEDIMRTIVTIEGVSKKDMEKMEKMTAIEVACDEAGVPTPQEVLDYLALDHEVVGKLRPGIDKGISSVSEDGFETIEIDLSRIDNKIDIIRITKPW